MQIITLRYRSTNYYLLDGGVGLLAFDGGWPNTFREYRDCLKAAGRKFSEIRWLVVSHFHIDHAGLAGDFADHGVEVVVFENQVDAIAEMEALITRKGMTCTPIDRRKLTYRSSSTTREWLAAAGIAGEIVRTDGHADQCVSLLLDEGVAFTGDLAPEAMVGDLDEKTRRNWVMLRARGVRRVLPAHGAEYAP